MCVYIYIYMYTRINICYTLDIVSYYTTLHTQPYILLDIVLYVISYHTILHTANIPTEVART